MIDHVYNRVINLRERTDRKSECLIEFQRANVVVSEETFFPAKRDLSDGAVGCALSHAQALSDFLFYTESDFALMLEDDFRIVQSENFLEDLDAIFRLSDGWDVFLLAHNQAVAVDPTTAPAIFRVANSQTLSAYVVRRSFAPKLISTFFESAEHLRHFRRMATDRRQLIHHLFAADMMWKGLQIEHKFLARFPAHITQRPSHSDIQGKFVDYGC